MRASSADRRASAPTKNEEGKIIMESLEHLNWRLRQMRDYPEVEKAVALSPMQESTRDRLLRVKKGLEEHLADVTQALDLLDRFPDMEKFQDIMRRV